MEKLEMYLEIFKAIVRAALAGYLVYTFCTLAMMGKISAGVVVAIVTMGITWYNREKENGNNTKKEEKKSE